MSWEVVPLGTLCDVYDGPHGTPAKTETGPWYLSISSLRGGRLQLAESAHLSWEDFSRWTKRVRPLPGDTLFSYETRLGESAYWELDVPAALGRRMGLLRPKPGVDPRFLSLAYQSPQFQGEIAKRAVQGATVDRIPIGEMAAWPIVVPPLDEQRRIAVVLGTLDDLVDTNERVAERATTLAQSLILRASAQLVGLSELAELADSRTVVPRGLTDHYSLPAFDNGRMPDRVDGVEIKSNKMFIDSDVVLLSRLNPHIPRVWVVYPDPAVMSAASTEFVPMRGLDVAVEEVFAVVSSDLYLMQLSSRVTGTTGSHQRVDKKELFELQVPDVRQLAANERLAITELVREAHASRNACAELRRIRDGLLSLLMSGAVRAEEVAA